MDANMGANLHEKWVQNMGAKVRFIRWMQT